MSRLPKLDISGRWFTDESGRRVILRGVNLGGDCKTPYPDGGTNVWSDFSDHRTVSFVNRPFTLAECDEHLARLEHWGFNVVRLLTTWEAVEHAGPGKYDEEYLEYLSEVTHRCGEFGMYVVIDFHQDAWSRMSGGDGAPGWTFEAVGLDFTKFHAAGAAHLMQAKYDYSRGGRQAGYPQMSWTSNYRLPANLIMWTLFFGGQTFTPSFLIEGRNVQDYLQDHFLGAMRQVARRVAPMAHVIGFDTLNEPGEGMIGKPLTIMEQDGLGEQAAPAHADLALSPLDALLMARGVAREVPRYARIEGGTVERVGGALANAGGVSIWRPGVSCPFEAAGVYRLVMEGVDVLRHDHFVSTNGAPVDVEKDFLLPFFRRVAAVVRRERADWLVFAEINPYKALAAGSFPPGMPERCVNASHWYDFALLRTKKFNYDQAVGAPFGVAMPDTAPLRERYIRELSTIAGLAEGLAPTGAPTLIGEFGLPFDLDDSAAYIAWRRGDRSRSVWAKQIAAQGLMYDAMDQLLLSSTQWNYTATNRNDPACGDGWNQEDLSIFSRDQHGSYSGPGSGGRAVEGFSRPYPRYTAGEPTLARFDPATGDFTLEFVADANATLPTELFVPSVHYPTGFKVSAPDDCDVRRSADGRYVWIICHGAGPRAITVRRAPDNSETIAVES